MTFKKLHFGFLLLIVSASLAFKLSFEDNQRTYERVRGAYERKEELFLMKCQTKNIPETFGNVFFRVFKKEKVLEVWVQNADNKWIKFSEYEVMAQSGGLGPKRKQGDCQVPEGFYFINDFNPYSSYHLSLGIDYPNQSDLTLSWAEKKGGDIYIHGGKLSAGCLAMSDYYIEDIYIAAVKARSQGQLKIPVHIFPFKMTNQNMQEYGLSAEYYSHHTLWKNLQQGYMHFENKGELPQITVGRDGYYRFADEDLARR